MKWKIHMVAQSGQTVSPEHYIVTPVDRWLSLSESLNHSFNWCVQNTGSFRNETCGCLYMWIIHTTNWCKILIQERYPLRGDSWRLMLPLHAVEHSWNLHMNGRGSHIYNWETYCSWSTRRFSFPTTSTTSFSWCLELNWIRGA